MIKLNREVYVLLYELNKFSPDTYEHSIRVANHCAAFGTMLGLSEDEVEKLKFGGLLHDIGKLKIPRAILHKPARLTEEEYNLIKKHPQYGINLLMAADFANQEILELVIAHHERLDGLGYPNKLTEKDISFLTRILTICDCYDAMIARRAYQGAMSMKYIRNELIENAGTQFDASLVDLFFTYLDNKLISGNSLVK